ncbi:GerAB/ArcD/ProY family transporter [Priestia megaterium]|uniref:GerAB/ArcD/ProY family transporter n=1 Tax=Priestia megaterium TaxID=1404 RepID=UPI00366DD901
MEKAKISASQLFILMVMFELGTSILLPMGMGAKQDAWLAILVGMIISFLLFFVYHQLYLYYPDRLLTQYTQEILGKFIGRILAFLYILYFAYFAARILRDFGELLLTFAYPETPLFIANALLMLVIIYTVRKGIEVISRSGELFFIFMYTLAVTGFILIIVSGLIHVTNLQPVLEKGMLPVLKVVFTKTLYYPFGQVIVFTMIFPYLTHSKKAKITGLCALGLSGINLAIIMLINISVLGVSLTERSQFPLLSTVQSIQVANFLERLDVFFMFALIITSFVKINVFFYAVVIGMTNLFKIQSPSRMTYPLGLVILFLSMTIASNYQEQFYEGQTIVPFILHLPFQVIIPLLLLTVVFLRKTRGRVMKNFKN